MWVLMTRISESAASSRSKEKRSFDSVYSPPDMNKAFTAGFQNRRMGRTSNTFW